MTLYIQPYPFQRAARRFSEQPRQRSLGVHRYPGDVLDVENHPTPGAHGRY